MSCFNGFLKAVGVYDSRVSAQPAVEQTEVSSDCDKLLAIIRLFVCINGKNKNKLQALS